MLFWFSNHKRELSESKSMLGSVIKQLVCELEDFLWSYLVYRHQNIWTTGCAEIVWMLQNSSSKKVILIWIKTLNKRTARYWVCLEDLGCFGKRRGLLIAQWNHTLKTIRPKAFAKYSMPKTSYLLWVVYLIIISITEPPNSFTLRNWIMTSGG